MLRTHLITAILLALVFSFSPAAGQNDTIKEEKKGYVFTDEIRLAATPVKNQSRSGTCWSFGTNSLIESELLRMDKGEFSLSEMFVVRHTYAAKADRYVRLHGHMNFSAGGALPDAFWVLKNFGMVPEEAYDGKVIGEENHVHGEMDAVLKAYVDAIIKNPNRKLTPVWKDGFIGLLETYLGSYPDEFTYKGRKYTPKSFADMLGVKADDFVQLSSFTHHPFYQPFIVEVPDNWNWDKAYNLPLEELMEVIDGALANGYTVVWASDISERGFSHRNGVAIVPETDPEILDGMERGRWEQLTQKEKDEMLYSFKEPVQEKKITQEERQLGFDNFTTTDDHAMHIIGTARDQNGGKYYIVKNSWGTDNNPYGGYLYASEAFVQYKTISIMVNKNAMSRKMRGKLGL
ncbi:MAG TPA: aminopeptidase [Bacteroidales bacterium]|nr:aminopeptidase [Bacteroidales bacterium]